MNTAADLFKIETNHVVPEKGSLLISEPFLQDGIFGRAVILLVDHSEGGSMGLVLNKPLPIHLGDVLTDFDGAGDIPLYRGGPVGTDTLFYLHTFAGLEGAMEVADGLWLNGDFEAVKHYIRQGNPVEGRLRFFLGYSGWDGGQLLREVNENAWLIGSGEWGEVMSPAAVQGLWKQSMCRLGGKYEIWSRFPRNPIFN